MFLAPAFEAKPDRLIRWLFIINGIIGIALLIGNGVGVFAVNVLSSFLWGVLFLITAVLLAKKFSRMEMPSTRLTTGTMIPVGCPRPVFLVTIALMYASLLSAECSI